MKTGTETFKLSDRLTITFTLAPDSRIDTTWTPCLPPRLTASEAREYRKARDIMLGRLASAWASGLPFASRYEQTK
jgi:hypothetical protein